MATFNTFEDIEAWKKAHRISLEIYRITNDSLLSRDYSLKDQMRRCSVSITSNIAEGFDREGPKEFARFLGISKGSSAELRSQLILARDLGYIGDKEFTLLNDELVDVNKMLGGLIRYLRKKVAG
jgi:four helix bundle protein